MDKDLSIIHRRILLKRIRWKIYDISLAESQSTKSKEEGENYIKLKCFYKKGEKVDKIKRQPTECEKIFAKNKMLENSILDTYQELTQLHNNRRKDLKVDRTSEKLLPREDRDEWWTYGTESAILNTEEIKSQT